jgi:16S rRNA C967 or C1407 C5-methylase (RsmB/RsmF family)/NOL1/NOP2/fmu family ribosome biogenesis protein
MKDLPEQLLKDLRSVQGFNEPAFVAAHQIKPPVSIRLHPIKKFNRFENDEPIPWCVNGRYLDQRPVFTLDPAFHAGAYYVQEASSMFLDHFISSIYPDLNNLMVLDLCAAPGGKSTLIASLLDKSSLLISNEVIRSRATILDENVSRWGYTNNWVTSNDAKDFGRLHSYFDLVVVDAPCSGSGLFRKDEKALDEWSESNVMLCSQRQQRILADVWPSIKEGGTLIYATCSYSPKEDEEILDWLADEFMVDQINIHPPEEWGITETHSSTHGLIGYRFFPDKISGEGFFIAAVRKISEETTLKDSRFKSLHDKKAWAQCGHLLKDDNFTLIALKEGYSVLFPEQEKDFQILNEIFYFRKAGLPVGNPSQKEWLPSHEIALSVDRSENIRTIELSRKDALKYLKKEEISIDTHEKGWHLMSYEGLGLGWIKSLGNRYNNYLPKNWRIRMEID